MFLQGFWHIRVLFPVVLSRAFTFENVPLRHIVSPLWQSSLKIAFTATMPNVFVGFLEFWHIRVLFPVVFIWG